MRLVKLIGKIVQCRGNDDTDSDGPRLVTEKACFVFLCLFLYALCLFSLQKICCIESFFLISLPGRNLLAVNKTSFYRSTSNGMQSSKK